MRLFTLLSLATLTAPALAQVYSDDFSYPNGTVIPGWTQQRGAWQVLNGRLSSTSGALWTYITKDGITAQNCVLDGKFYYNPSTAVQFAGLASHHQGTANDSGVLMVKIQNNGGVADFDRVFEYERVYGSNIYADIPGGTVAAECRMITLDNEFWIEVDADMDGFYEQGVTHHAITTVTAPGLVGMCAYQSSEMDDFQYFDAVLVPTATSTPRIGTNFNLRLATPTPNVPWIGMLSGGNAGVQLGQRAVPLTADGLLVVSIGVPGLGLVGLTDQNGDGAMSFPLPQNPSLVGLRLYLGAFTIDPSQPFGIGHISNEHGFEIQP